MQNLAGGGEHDPAGIGQLDTTAGSFIQLDPEVVLERSQTLGNGGRAHVHPARRFGDALMLGNVYEKFDTIKQHNQKVELQ